MNKMEELKKVVGEEVSENFSPTLRAKLIGFKQNQCVMEVVASPYKFNDDENHRAGERYLAPIYRIHNAYFF
jgi:hypothetical protein